MELALSDPEEAWKLIRALLQEGALPNRTWLLFRDEELQRKWLGLYDDTPAPPMALPE